MIRSMYSAISGLRGQQTMMDVVGNNIANVNTTGYKGSAVVFQDLLSQTLRGAGAPAGAIGGTNPAQIGLGTKVAGVTMNMAQGALQRTGRPTDVAIQGDGFFMVNQGGERLYTRAGSFSVDADGSIVTQEGGFVQGWTAVNGEVNSNGPVGNLQIPMGGLVAPNATLRVTMGGNLDSETIANVTPSDPTASPAVEADPAGSEVVASVEVFDARGASATVRLVYTKTSEPQVAPSTWTIRAFVPDPADPTGPMVACTMGGTTTVAFDASGRRTSANDVTVLLPAAEYPTFTQTISMDFGEADAAGSLTGFAKVNTAAVTSQDGYSAGSLQSFSISQTGEIVGAYSNGQTSYIGQVALTTFANPEGLEKVGGSNYRATMNSGLAQVGTAGIGGRGLLTGGTLEMSNVDLAQEFTNLIVAQRGFQANSRVVTSSDELLQEVVNLKR